MRMNKIQFKLAALLCGIGTMSIALAEGPTFNNTIVQISDQAPHLFMEDTSTDETDWGICVDDGCSFSGSQVKGAIHFMMVDGGTVALPFVVESGTTSHTLYVDTGGRIGINTNVPREELQINGALPAIRLNDISAKAGRADLQVSTNEFAIEGNRNQDIVEIDTRAPQHALTVRRNGNVGVGLLSPAADLHVRGEGVGNAEELLRLESSTLPRMMYRNSSTGKNWLAGMNAGNHLVLTANGTSKTEAKFARGGNLVIAGSLTQNSDRNNKEAIEPVDSVSVLEAVANLPISTWEYKEQDGVKHLGPMAQDFHAAFGLGDDPKGISSVDTGGVALAAIKGLNEVVQVKDKEIEALREESRQLKGANEELSARLTMLEKLVNKLATKEVVMNP